MRRIAHSLPRARAITSPCVPAGATTPPSPRITPGAPWASRGQSTDRNRQLILDRFGESAKRPRAVKRRSPLAGTHSRDLSTDFGWVRVGFLDRGILFETKYHRH